MNSWKKYISEINLTQKNRSIGFLFVALGLVISAIRYKRAGEFAIFFEEYYALLIFIVLSLLVTLIRPRLLRPITVAWFFLGWVLNIFFSPIIMGVMYFLVVTPFGLCRKFFGLNLFRKKAQLDEVNGTFWIQRDPAGPSPDSLKMQF